MIDNILTVYDRAERTINETVESIHERRQTRWVAIIGVAAAVVAAPFILDSSMIRLGIELSIYAIFAMSLNLLLGYTGYISFGHAAFFGTPAYVALGLMVSYTQSVWIILPVAVLVTLLVAVAIGYLSLQRHGIYFAMLTLALSQLLYVLVQGDFMGLTGGSDGLVSIDHANFGIPGVFDVQLSTGQYFWASAITLALVYYALRRLVNSPFGSVIIAIRENEDRVAFSGYNVMKYKLASFTISAGLCAISGVLFAFYYRAIDPERMFWLWSGEGIAMVILGGSGTIIGPAIGAAGFIGIRETSSVFLEEWTIVLGIVFVIVMLVRSRRN